MTAVAPRPSPPAPGPVLLFVDDNIMVRSAVAAYLRECGYAVIEAASTDEAVTLIDGARHEIDIVFADIDTRGSLSGFELSHWIGEQDRGIQVVLSATVQRAAKLAAQLCEKGPHLRKPYDHPALLDFVRRIRSKA